MATDFKKGSARILTGSAVVLAASLNVDAYAQQTGACDRLPSHAQLRAALRNAQAGEFGANGGLGNDMWGTVVDRSGTVCAVARTAERGEQWPGSRVISAQKANTANAFSLAGNYPNVGIGRALSTGNLYGLVIEGGSLYGLQFSNPVDPAVAYAGGANQLGEAGDPMVGARVGGVNVFGGGLALYSPEGELVGGLGVSGDTSCTDHITAWKVRWVLNHDNIPGGVGPGETDNLNIADPPAPNSFEHPSCGFGEEAIISELNLDFPVGSAPPEE